MINKEAINLQELLQNILRFRKIGRKHLPIKSIPLKLHEKIVQKGKPLVKKTIVKMVKDLFGFSISQKEIPDSMVDSYINNKLSAYVIVNEKNIKIKTLESNFLNHLPYILSCKRKELKSFFKSDRDTLHGGAFFKLTNPFSISYGLDKRKVYLWSEKNEIIKNVLSDYFKLDGRNQRSSIRSWNHKVKLNKTERFLIKKNSISCKDLFSELHSHFKVIDC